jgi:hypothetical protein
MLAFMRTFFGLIAIVLTAANCPARWREPTMMHIPRQHRPKMRSPQSLHETYERQLDQAERHPCREQFRDSKRPKGHRQKDFRLESEEGRIEKKAATCEKTCKPTEAETTQQKAVFGR